MDKDKSLNLRLTDERKEAIEYLRKKLKKSGRDVQKVHGVVTTAAIIDEAFKELRRVLDEDGKP